MKIMIFLFAMLLIFGFSCNKDEDIDQGIDCTETRNRLIGIWIEKEPANDGIIDTLIFTEDNYVRSYFPFDESLYSLPTCDSLAIIKPDGSKSFEFYFEFQPNEEIIIYNFIDRSITQVIKDIEFYKNK